MHVRLAHKSLIFWQFVPKNELLQLHLNEDELVSNMFEQDAPFKQGEDEHGLISY